MTSSSFCCSHCTFGYGSDDHVGGTRHDGTNGFAGILLGEKRWRIPSVHIRTLAPTTPARNTTLFLWNVERSLSGASPLEMT